jgi:hypothetical protein
VSREAAVLVAFLLTASGAGADDDTIVTDRPGYGESADVVSSRRVQVETGLAWTRVSDDATLFDLPQALVRVGLGRSLEVRLTAPDWLRAGGPGGTASGWSDTALGVKWHLAWRGNDFALRGTLYLGMGSLGFSDRHAEPEAALSWSREMSHRWSLSATLGVRHFRPLGGTLFSPSVSVGCSLGSRVGTFVEYGAGLENGLGPVHALDHGYTWLVGPDAQVDFSLGVGLSTAAPDFFVALGFSRRF